MLDNVNTRMIFRAAFSLALLLILIPIGIYCFQFAGNGLSQKPQHWAALSDYLNVWVSMASLIFLATLTYVLDRQRGADEQARNRPLVIFRVDHNEKVWYLKNVGNGVALDIDISRLEKTGDGELWEIPVKVYALMSGEEFKIFWFRAAGKICATYNGVLDEKKLITIIEGDKNRFPNVNPINSFQQSNQFIRIEDAPEML
ncbi:hypothetical protein [Persicitalea sp.]|uniref:hypothetical protein n=1 Tax=Persicitalea sp. TaxID=3100273 RepID=UPI0035948B6C